jgi:CDP-diacylglycerol--glycerol-3-phosphate 3-phosphatidyltransferase
MKNVANILTASRIALALILLLFFKKISVLFLIIYTVAEFTDIIDGTIARKMGSCSHRGAVLDSIADLLLSANLIKIVFSMKLITEKLAIWLLIALGIGALSPIINYLKYKKVFFIHSIPCKICGGIISIVPFAIYFGFIEEYLIFAIACVTLAMIEICIMSIISDELDPNAKSIYSLIKSKI